MDNKILFKRDIIYEVIITTSNLDGSPNASPMGIVYDTKNITIKPFDDSDTSKNLIRNKFCVINLTSDPSLFTYSALFQEELTPNHFTTLNKIPVPILSACKDAFISLRVKEMKDIAPERKAFICEIEEQNVKQTVLLPYTRAFSSLIEILIHATRIVAFADDLERNRSNIKQLSYFIQHHKEIIKRITDENSIYQQLLYKIIAKIEPIIRIIQR
jgi:hypothetical protein